MATTYSIPGEMGTLKTWIASSSDTGTYTTTGTTMAINAASTSGDFYGPITGGSYTFPAGTWITIPNYINYPPAQQTIPNIIWDPNQFIDPNLSGIQPGHLPSIDLDAIFLLLMKNGFENIKKIEENVYTATYQKEKCTIMVKTDPETKLPLFKIEKESSKGHRNRYEIIEDIDPAVSGD